MVHVPQRAQATGLCHAAAIPAELIEGHVLDHVEAFVGAPGGWLAGAPPGERPGARRLSEAVDRRREQHRRPEAPAGGADGRVRPACRRGPQHRVRRAEAVEKADPELRGRRRSTSPGRGEGRGARRRKPTSSTPPPSSPRSATASRQPRTSRRSTAALARGLAGLWASVEDGHLTVELELANRRSPADHRQGVHLLQHAKPVGLRRPQDDAAASYRAHTWSSAGLSLPSLDVPADPMVGGPTGRVSIVEPIENPVPTSPLSLPLTSRGPGDPRSQQPDNPTK